MGLKIDDPIHIEPLGDIHFGAGGFMVDVYRKAINRIRDETNRITLFMGDQLDAITPYDKRFNPDTAYSHDIDEQRQEWQEETQPLIDEHKKGSINIDQIKLARGPHADYSNEKQTLFNLQDKIEEDIRNYYNSDFSNLQSKFHKKHIRDTRFNNEEINTDFVSSELYPYKAKILTSAEWKESETTNVESTHQSVQAKKENQENNILQNCRHCQGYGCLRCNDTGYDDH